MSFCSHVSSQSQSGASINRDRHMGPVVHLPRGRRGGNCWKGTLCYYPCVSGPQLNYNYRVSEEDRELMGPRPGNELWGG